MRRFHLPLIIGFILSLTLALLLVLFRSPYADSTNQLALTTVVSLLFLVTLAVTFGLSLLLYFVKCFVGPVFDERQATRASLRQAFWVGVGLTIIGFLKIFEVLNPLTLVLTVITLIIFELALRQ